MGKDTYTWHAAYADGSSIREDDHPGGLAFSEVDQDQVKVLILDPLQSGMAAQSVVVPDSASPVFFRRRQIELNPNTDEEKRGTVHCIGWQRETDAVYLFVFGDGSCLLTDDLQAV